MRRLMSFVALALLVTLAAACSDDKKSSNPSSGPAPTSPAPSSSTTARRAASSSTTIAGNLAAARVGLAPAATGLESPVDIAWRPGDARMYVAEQAGTVRLVDAGGQLLPTPVLDVAVSHGNEQGLLGLTFSTDGKLLYVDYTDPDGHTHVDEYAMKGDVADTGSRRQVLFQTQPYPNHNGGQVMTGPDGMLYITFGDGGSQGDPHGNAQNLNVLLGKILRINPKANGSVAYTVPADNPFVGRSGARGEVWMYGLRNPWRFSFDRASGDVWIGDVGQNAYEEVDYAPSGEAGINWGWNLREASHAYRGARPAGARDSILETTHADGNCAIVGGYVYRGRAIPALNGVYLFGDNCKRGIYGAVQSGGRITGQRALNVDVPALTSFGEDPSGEVYAIARGGTIYRFTQG